MRSADAAPLGRYLRLAVLAGAALLCACSGNGKDTSEPPAELQKFDAKLDVHKIWSANVGGGSERLRLGLKPSTNGINVFAAGHDGKVVALDATTGDRVWRVDTKLALSAGPGYDAGLLAVGTTDGDLLALDAETGQERWRRQVGSEVMAPPAIGSGVVVLRTVDGRLRGFSAMDGSELWTVEQSKPALILRGDTAPQISSDTVVAGFDNGHIGAYRITDGQTVWELPLANPTGRTELDRLVDISAGLVVVANDVYAVGYQGRAVGVDLNTGLLLWQQDMSSFSGLDVDADNVYVTNDIGSVIALSRRGGVPVWRQDALRLRDLTAPTRFKDALVVGDFEGYLHWLDITDGSFLARVRAAHGRITSAPLVVRDSIVVQSEDGSVSAYTTAEPES
ncbi:MAG TPA: outer membrane protein assembly factor BamB [Gammaproteobacteria bacterium]|nr:outer membrane protein assembly factor BamB [Gammaproteobacteria bacterium]